MQLTMKKWTALFSAMLMVLLMVVHMDADARRMGGGKSAGRQSSNVTQREATPPAAPGQNAATNNATRQQPNAATNAANARPRSPMMGMLGGLAAGLGLAWLASSLGFGEEFGAIMLMILLGLVVAAAVGMFLRSRNRTAAQGAGLGLAGAAAGAAPGRGTDPAAYRESHTYNPKNVGNDASARPFDQQGYAAAASAAGGSMIGSGIGSALAGNQGWGIPADFDTAGFLTAAKHHFTSLQKAWDTSDLITLRAMMTDEMLSEIRQQLAERDASSNGQPNHTEVITLDAHLLGIEELNDVYMASVEFSGLIQEDPAEGPTAFREVWNMTKPRNGGSGWLVAGLQALQ